MKAPSRDGHIFCSESRVDSESEDPESPLNRVCLAGYSLFRSKSKFLAPDFATSASRVVSSLY